MVNVQMVILSAILLGGIGTNSQGQNAVLALEKGRFIAADNSEFANPEFDDSSWLEVSMPDSWDHHQTAITGDVGWYRFEVSSFEEWKGRSIAVAPGYIGNVAEIYWNGELIGEKGNVDKKLGLEWMGKYQVFTVKPPILYERKNILAIRVYHFFSEGGLLGSVPLVGDEELLTLESYRRNQSSTFWLNGQLFLYFLGVIVSVLIFLFCPRYPQHWLFLGFVFGETGMRFLSGWMLLTDAAFSELLHRIAFCGYWGFYSSSLLILVHYLFEDSSSKLCWRLAVFMVMLAIASVFVSSLVPVLLVWIPLVVANGVAMLWIGWILWRHVRKGSRRALISLSAWVIVAVSYTPDALNYFIPFWAEVDCWTPPSSWTGIVLVFLYAGLLIDQLAAYKVRARSMAGMAFSAAEKERARIARELHDGIGSELFSLKQQIKSGERDQLGLIAEVEKLIGEMRAVSHGLHPSCLAERSLEDICEEYADRISGPEFTVKLSFSRPGIAPDVDRELFRIFQEFLRNSLQAGAASEVTVCLDEVDGGGWTFSLENDATDFDPNKLSNGMGLISIQERAQELDAALSWERSKSGVCLAISSKQNMDSGPTFA